ncbi:MAG TPA: alpha-(1-_3)-arabinofuranosyltransferase family protein [Acidimicrobiales bacterium]|nr:alpha-(1->3)-arabinofuranosyltransferase family protein [Acidimicrobiales bacterium]
MTSAPGRLRAVYAAIRSPSRLRSSLDYLVIALFAFVPMLASRTGTVSDDTKTYLYLDPGRYIRQAVSLWDPNVALGTVTHENIGYLLPMGPFFWVLAELHVPLWIAQRLWMGLILFAAGAGVLYLCRVIGLTGPGRYVAALAFFLTPYALQYAGRESVILLPWPGLPWMLAFVILALRKGGWRYPALFALVVALVSGINASSIIYVGFAPVLWLIYAVVIAKEGTWRRAWGVAWKVGLLTVLASLWWGIGLQVEAAFGVNVLKYTETVPATSATGLASEVLRGLGYWYFYGTDRAGAWTQSSIAYTQNLWLLGVSFAVPVIAILAAVVVRWRHRAYFILIILLGVLLSVGAYPYNNPSGIGSVLKYLMVNTTAGLAMRSTDRATPLVLLGLAMLLGAGVSALVARVRLTGILVGAGAVGVIIAATTPLWTGAIIANGFTQPAKVPNYVQQAANHLNTVNKGTRVFAIPGNNFGAYRWGDTIDTVWPALLTRPFVTHEQQIMGSLPTASVLNAIDVPIQEGTMDWNTLAPMASLMSAGDVLVQYDQQYERYDTPDPQILASNLTPTPPGLSNPVNYGAPRPNVATIPRLDEASLGQPPNAPWPSPLVSYTVANPRPIARGESTAHPLVVDGDATGIVNAAALGMLSTNPTILYAGTLDTNAALRKSTLSHPADLVVTDTNRKRGFRWNSLEENAGYTETKSQNPIDPNDPSDTPLNIFAKAPADAQTTTTFEDISAVSASTYANSITYFAEDRPSAALDGNTQTAWLDDAFAPSTGQWWQVTLDKPTTDGTVTLVQPQTGDPNRWITRVTLTFDGKSPVTIDLGKASRTAAGQKLSFTPRTFTTMRIRVDAFGGQRNFNGASPIGLAEVQIPGIVADETVALPQDLLRAAGTTSANDRLTFVFTRLRSSGAPPRSDIEPFLSRSFWMPTARTFDLTGQARISPLIPDDAIDRLVGRPGADGKGITAYSSGRLNGDLTAGAIQTLDGNSQTAWQTGLGASHQAGSWLKYDLPAPITFSTVNLQLLADGHHSVPTSVTVSTENGSHHLTLPPIANGKTPGSVVNVPLSFPALTGSHITITFDTVRLVYTVNYYTESPQALPLGVAEVGIPGLHAAPLPASIPVTCRDDLLSIDNQPVWIVVSGSTQTALGRTNPLNVTLCGPDQGGIPLGAGTHTLTSAYGDILVNNQLTTGFDLDRLALDSAPGGAPAAAVSASAIAGPPTQPTTPVTITSQTATAIHLRVTKASGPFELILGQSINSGWTANVPGVGNLGQPVLVDGFANGWKVTSADLAKAGGSGSFDVNLRWTPQTRVNVALIVSGLTILLCLLMGYLPERVRRRIARRLRHPIRGARARSGEDQADLGPVPIEAAAWAVPAPRLWAPFRANRYRTGWLLSLGVALATGLVGGFISRPITGLAVGVATLLALLVPRTRLLLGVAAVGLMIAAGTYTVVEQARFHIAVNGNWAMHFDLASDLAWAAVVFLAADATVEVIRRLISSRSSGRGPRRGPGAHARRRGSGSGPVPSSETGPTAPPGSSEPLVPSGAGGGPDAATASGDG